MCKKWIYYVLRHENNELFIYSSQTKVSGINIYHKSLRVIPTSIFHKTMSSRKAIDEFPVNLHLKFTQVNFYK